MNRYPGEHQICGSHRQVKSKKGPRQVRQTPDGAKMHKYQSSQLWHSAGILYPFSAAVSNQKGDFHSGNQVMKSKTWTPAPGLTERQIEKELTRQMVLFDEECRGSSLTDGHIKFETFAGQWFTEYVEKALGKKTQANYRQMAPRIYEGIGHLYMDKITPRQLQKFINGMEGLSPKTIKNHLSLISSVFTYAVKMGMIQHLWKRARRRFATRWRRPRLFLTLCSVPHSGGKCSSP